MTSDIKESVKTLKEAESYKEMIDDTVREALIKDKVNGKTVWSYKA